VLEAMKSLAQATSRVRHLLPESAGDINSPNISYLARIRPFYWSESTMTLDASGIEYGEPGASFTLVDVAS
jgi:hypothetical protein